MNEMVKKYQGLMAAKKYLSNREGIKAKDLLFVIIP